MPGTIFSNRQRADESFQTSTTGILRALAMIKAAKDDEDQKKRQDLQDEVTRQSIKANDMTLQQKQGEQGLVSQYNDRLTRDATPGAAGPALPGEANALPTPFTNKSNSDAFKYDIIKKLRMMRGQDPGDPMAESQARQAETDKIVGDAQVAPQLRALNIQKTTADIGHTNAAAGLATAEAAKAYADAEKAKKTSTAGKQPNKEQFDAAGFGRRMEQAVNVFNNLSAGGYNRASAASGVGAMLPNAMKSKEAQQQDQAERNFINATLRRESGAAISPSEFENAEKQYFPRTGDSKEVLDQKAANRAQVMENMRAASGNAWDLVKPMGSKVLNIGNYTVEVDE